MVTAVQIKFYSSTATAIILLVTYSATLIRVLRGSRFQLVIRLIVILMLYNVGELAHYWLLNIIVKMSKSESYNNSVMIGLLAAEGLGFIVEKVCFNVSHWMYAFQYYKIARQAPFSIEMDYVPEKIIKADNILNKITLSLNIVLPLVAGSCTFLANF